MSFCTTRSLSNSLLQVTSSRRLLIAWTASDRCLGLVDPRFFTTGKIFDSRRALLAALSAGLSGRAMGLDTLLTLLFRFFLALPIAVVFRRFRFDQCGGFFVQAKFFSSCEKISLQGVGFVKSRDCGRVTFSVASHTSHDATSRITLSRVSTAAQPLHLELFSKPSR